MKGSVIISPIDGRGSFINYTDAGKASYNRGMKMIRLAVSVGVLVMGGVLLFGNNRLLAKATDALPQSLRPSPHAPQDPEANMATTALAAWN
jgi:hypothetical protein